MRLIAINFYTALINTLMHYYINQTNSVTISLSGSEFCKNKSRSYSLSFYLSVIWNKLECQHY